MDFRCALHHIEIVKYVFTVYNWAILKDKD